jgi:ABC-type polysaccharide/polyol phosphate export permease
LLFYCTPIIYAVSLIPERMRSIVLASPMAQIIQDTRGVVVHPSSGTGLEGMPLAERLIPIGITVLIFGIGWLVFRRAADRAAEYV